MAQCFKHRRYYLVGVGDPIGAAHRAEDPLTELASCVMPTSGKSQIKALFTFPRLDLDRAAGASVGHLYLGCRAAGFLLQGAFVAVGLSVCNKQSLDRATGHSTGVGGCVCMWLTCAAHGLVVELADVGADLLLLLGGGGRQLRGLELAALAAALAVIGHRDVPPGQAGAHLNRENILSPIKIFVSDLQLALAVVSLPVRAADVLEYEGAALGASCTGDTVISR